MDYTKERDALRKKIEQAIINDTFMDIATDHNTHIDRHKNIPDKESMERTLDDVSINSVFDSEADTDYLITEAVMYKAEDIADWQLNARPYESKGFMVSLPKSVYGITGKGFVHDSKTNLIKEYETDSICVVLKQSPNAKLGFSLLTAYPEMDSPDITPTNRNLTEITKQTKQYNTADPIGKAYMLYRTDPRNDTSVAYRKGSIPEDSVVYMHIDTENPNLRHIVKIKEQGATMRTVRTDASQEAVPTKYTQIRDRTNLGKTFRNLDVRLSSEPIRNEFFKDHPKQCKAISAMLKNTRNAIPDDRKFQNNNRRIQMAEASAPSTPQADTEASPDY